ncbi:hypothetical protein DDK22_36330 [Cupriavidus necator]|uniref:Uncharacterized protein n=1 Tax=Cupriavidus necator TaxID=106590 RepID=A0A367P734_CUPNE|nr:hypothetical protein DDK22_36330 [Cupriavidus necator]
MKERYLCPRPALAHLSRRPPYDTMNARSETVGKKRSFSGPWNKGQLCLVQAYRLLCMVWTSHNRSAAAACN